MHVAFERRARDESHEDLIVGQGEKRVPEGEWMMPVEMGVGY